MLKTLAPTKKMAKIAALSKKHRSCTPNEILTFRCTELILSHDKLFSMPQVAPILPNMYIIHNNTHLGPKYTPN